MTRRTTWLIDMGDGTWAVCCMACRIALYRGPKAGADRAARQPLLRTRRPPRPPAPTGLTRGPPWAPVGGATPDPSRGRTRRPPPTTTLVKEQLVNSRIRWGQPPAGWGPPPDGPRWSTTAPSPSRPPARSAAGCGRPWRSTGFLVVTGFVLGHDDPAPGLSLRGLCTIALAAAVVVLLTLRRTAGPGPLARALFEYAVVFLLAVLVATTGIDLDQAPAGGTRPAPPATSDPR